MERFRENGFVEIDMYSQITYSQIFVNYREKRFERRNVETDYKMG